MVLFLGIGEGLEDFWLATDAYIYGYRLVTMEITRRVFTNVAAPVGTRGPMGQIIKLREYPNASFRDVTAPNADTLYTSAVLAQDLDYTTVLPYCIRRQLALYLMLALRSSGQFSLLLIVIFYVLRFGLASAGSGATRRTGVACGWGVIIFCRFGFVRIRRVEITHFSLSDEEMQALTSYIRSHGTSIATRRRYC